MAAENRKQDSFIARLQASPEKFEFFQAIRLLQQAEQEVRTRSNQDKDGANNLSVFGTQFKAALSLNFPKSSIYSITINSENTAQNFKKYYFETHVSFLGLAGINGILPDHYTELLIGQVRSHNYAFRDFLDIFNHRCITLFYQAWEKYHFPFIVSDSLNGNREKKNFTHYIESIYGNGTPSLRERLHVPEKILSYYSGLFARKVRSAIDLESILNDYFDIPINIKQFQEQYTYIEEQDLSRLSNKKGGRYNQLGISFLVGKKITSVANSFRIFVGPLSFDQFQSFLPSQSSFFQLCNLVKFYAGPQYIFDLQLILKKEDVPFCELSRVSPVRLGWETWIGTKTPFTDPQDTVLKYNVDKEVRSKR